MLIFNMNIVLSRNEYYKKISIQIRSNRNTFCFENKDGDEVEPAKIYQICFEIPFFLNNKVTTEKNTWSKINDV